MNKFELEKFKKRIKEDLDNLGLNDVALVIEKLRICNYSPHLSICWIKDGSFVENIYDDYVTDEFKNYQIFELDSILRFLGNKIVYYSNGEVTIKEKEK